MTRFEALVSLNMVADIGGVRLAKLLDFYPSPQAILESPAEELSKVSGVSRVTACRIASFKEESVRKELTLAQKLGLRIITIEDQDYPEILKHIPSAPIVLYIKGTLDKEDGLSVAIVGSRHASFYGISSANHFAKELALRGFTIISGMARGVDAAAHKGALQAGGRTIAVMGSGFANIYPKENEKLADQIASSGAVLSEFPIMTSPLRQNFPRRNRIISGLSMGTLVVEAARNSGALITADFALEQGREVFALPGRTDTENSFGTNSMIKEGAKLVLSVDDILEEFSFSSLISSQDTQTPKCAGQAKLPDGQSHLYDIITAHPLSLDEIVAQSRCGVAEVSETILHLRLKKLIQQLPGNLFVRSS